MSEILENENNGTDNKVVTSLPLNNEQLDKYYDDIDDYMFFIDLDPTKLDAKGILNYVYNSGMTCDIKIDEMTESNTEKLNDLLVEYIKIDKLVYIDLLSELWGSVCLHVLYPDLESPVEEVHTFVAQFIEKHKELAEEVTSAVSSMYYHLLNMMFKESAGDVEFESKRLSDNIGINIVNLRKSGNFWSFFMNIGDYKGEIYDYEDFSEQKYEGSRLSDFFFRELSPFTSVVEMNRNK